VTVEAPEATYPPVPAMALVAVPPDPVVSPAPGVKLIVGVLV
jgi:hypothetical protein